MRLRNLSTKSWVWIMSSQPTVEDIEALIARANTWLEAPDDGSSMAASMLVQDMTDALELLSSPTPTGDEREGKFSAEAFGWIRNYHGSVDSTALLMAFDAGRRVAPEPVYEYRRVDQNGRVRFGAEFSSMPLLDEGWSAERRTVGVWERLPVVSTSKEQDQ